MAQPRGRAGSIPPSFALGDRARRTRGPLFENGKAHATARVDGGRAPFAHAASAGADRPATTGAIVGAMLSTDGLRGIEEVAAELGVDPEHLSPRGRDVAKIDPAAITASSRRGKLVLVSAITPTPAGEGKTTTSVALSMGLRRIGRRAVACLREPSLGPVFGVKGGGTGGGKAILEPEERINLHFTGDLHAIGAAHNLLAAILDNDLHFGASSGLDPRKVTWPRVMDMNDRALRSVLVGLNGEGVARETRFDITAASEVMAVLCLSSSLDDLRTRLGRMVVGRRADGSFVTCDDLKAASAMTALLTEALWPNLAQTAEGGPAIVHGGPFANIAHGCSSVLGTRLGLAYGDVAVTEAGFGFDLGGEKFLDVKCRAAGLWPDAVVLVATLRALKMHGGVPLAAVGEPNAAALEKGLANLEAHLDGVAKFGLTPVVALNEHSADSTEELERVRAWCAERGVTAARCTGFARGGEGAVELAHAVAEALEKPPTEPKFLYPLDAPLAAKVERVAKELYGADGVDITPAAKKSLQAFEAAGYGNLPICVAKTFRSISDDQNLLGRPRGFRATVREARLSAGAGFVVLLMGDVMTMPGLPKRPAALDVQVDADGTIDGLMRKH